MLDPLQISLPATSSALLQDIERLQAQRISQAEEDIRDKWNQFFTNAAVATYMAATLPKGEAAVRILDPGAGVGILGIAAAERCIAAGATSVELVCVEAEQSVVKLLHQALRRASTALGKKLTTRVIEGDFLELGSGLGEFDVIISNPPYAKVSPNHPKGSDAPNLYARFMDVSADILRRGGMQCFIIPRSYASGVYFRRFRERLHRTLALERVHLFDARNEAFGDQGVLQETVIVNYRRAAVRDDTDRVSISLSQGAADLWSAKIHRVPRSELIPTPTGMLFLPPDAEDACLLRAMRKWPSRLADYGCEISTGPVVVFRSREFIGHHGAPLLWMNHVQEGEVMWPLEKFKKSQHINASAPQKLLVPNRNYVLLRRFSAREESKRLTAAPLLADQLPCDFLGLENHLNFIHKPGGLLEHEAVGLAALLNSSALDRYFRISAGNTQVNATQVRELPLPSPELTAEIGAALLESPDVVSEDVVLDRLTAHHLL